MAKLSSHDIVLRFESSSRGVHQAVSNSGIVLARSTGGTWKKAGKVKPGVTAGQYIEVMERSSNAYQCTLRRIGLDHVFRTEAKARSEDKSRAKRAEQRSAARAEQKQQEEVVLNRPLDPVGRAILETHVAIYARNNVRCFNPTLEYLRQSCRFHGGATGGNIYGIMSVGFMFDSVDRAFLEPIAERAAVIAYGSHMRGAALWAGIWHE